MDIELDRFDPRRPTVGAIPEVAIVIPTLNERDNIALLVERLARTLTSFPWEAIFVDDDSADGTIHEVRRIAQSDTRIRGIRRLSRRGLAGAALEGMLSTSAKFVVVMDGDLQHDEARIVEMLSVLRGGEADIVVASRYCSDKQDSLVGLSGLVVNIAVLALLLARHVGFVEAQTAAVLTALTSNYLLNNAFTYRDRRLRGWRVLVGFMSFAAVCSLGVVGAIGVSTLLYQAGAQWWFAGIASAAMGALWNYVVTSAITWSAL
jgi:glycosyltransferase involved in cell wall biosynthesis